MTNETSAVASNNGAMVNVPNLTVQASSIHNFVERFRKEYFEDHSLDWCLDQIITRGKAEIERQVKTARERARQKAAGDLVNEFHLTPAQARQFLAEAIAAQNAKAKQGNGQAQATPQATAK